MTRCPQCKRVSQKDGNKVFPFCCERCQLVDLGKWLAEEYRIPDAPADGDVASTPPVPPSPDDEH